MSRVVTWWYGDIFRRLSASEPMSMAGRRNVSDTRSKPGELRGRGVAQPVGLGRCRKRRCRKLFLTVIRKNRRRRIQRVALLKVEHPRKR